MVGAGNATDSGGENRAAAERVRGFVGLPLPADLRERIWSRVRGMEAALPGVKWVRKRENLHVTMKFLGQVVLARLDELSQALQSALTEVSPFEARVAGFGAFPEAQQAVVLWARVDDHKGRLAQLAGIVEGTAAKFGFAPPEVRSFQPHVTVGRCPSGVDARSTLGAMADEVFGDFSVDALDVYQSILGQSAAIAKATDGSPIAQSAHSTPTKPTDEGTTYLLRGRAELGGSAQFVQGQSV